MTAEIGMLLLHPGRPRDQEALTKLGEALPDAELGEPDELGVFEISVPAEDQEGALRKVWDAVAASGTDDHVMFLEHPELPDHWRRFSGAPR